ncbi:MAG: glycosyltransferase family 4 protein [Bacteroidetes bacterium]|nr:glycosyltransferase family 4 protein [Bacteroidota bacterium]
MSDVGRIRVVFDAHALTPHRSGIGEYSWHLLRALVNGFRDRVELYLYVPSGIHPATSEKDILRLTTDIHDGDFFKLQHQWRLPAMLRGGGYDLLHTPDFLVPLLCPVPVVCTIHDIIPIVHPEFIPRSLKVRLLPVFRAWARRAAQHSAAVITDSAHSRDDIMRMLGGREERIAVVPLAPTLDVGAGSLPAEYAGQLQKGGYFLYVGRHDPYKGLAHLLRAFAEARENGGLGDVHLAVAGKSDARYGYLELVTSLGLGECVHFLDYVPPDALSALYANALAYVHPSLYEGFGLPPLDAMRHGTPVICSDRSSLPEVVGDAALLVDPEQVKSFARILRNVAESATLRSTLIQKGFEHVRQFSWNLTAAKTVDVYMRVIHATQSPS